MLTRLDAINADAGQAPEGKNSPYKSFFDTVLNFVEVDDGENEAITSKDCDDDPGTATMDNADRISLRKIL